MLSVMQDAFMLKKSSLLIDTTGIIHLKQKDTAFTFFKYKGEVCDLAEFIVKVGLGSLSQEEAVEKCRKTAVYALKADGMLVINLDKMRTNLREFFK